MFRPESTSYFAEHRKRRLERRGEAAPCMRRLPVRECTESHRTTRRAAADRSGPVAPPGAGVVALVELLLAGRRVWGAFWAWPHGSRRSPRVADGRRARVRAGASATGSPGDRLRHGRGDPGPGRGTPGRARGAGAAQRSRNRTKSAGGRAGQTDDVAARVTGDDRGEAAPRSAALFERAAALTPGGVNSPVRAFRRSAAPRGSWSAARAHTCATPTATTTSTWSPRGVR